MNLPAELVVHLTDNEVAVMFEITAAPGQQAVTSAVAVRADGKVATLKTTDMYGIDATKSTVRRVAGDGLAPATLL